MSKTLPTGTKRKSNKRRLGRDLLVAQCNWNSLQVGQRAEDARRETCQCVVAEVQKTAQAAASRGGNDGTVREVHMNARNNAKHLYASCDWLCLVARTLWMAKFLQTHQGSEMRSRVPAGLGSCLSWMSNCPSAAGLSCLRLHAERIRIRSMSMEAGLCCRKSR